MSEPSSLRAAEQPTVSEAGPEREWLTYAEAGQVVGLSRVTLWKLVSAGDIEAARVGRAVRINRELDGLHEAFGHEPRRERDLAHRYRC